MMRTNSNLKVTKKNIRKRKIFMLRESVLTENPNFATIKSILYCVLLGFILRDVTVSFVLKQKVTYGLYLLQHGFDKFPITLMVWCLFFCFNLLTYFFYNFWSNLRVTFAALSKLLDWIFLVIFLSYIAGILYLVPFVVKNIKMGLVTAFVFCIEQIRLLMKSYAFIRTNVPNVLNYQQHTDKMFFRPSLKHYLYFSFAPTLVYRHEYPRYNVIRWTFVTQHFFEFVACIWTVSYVAETVFLYKIQNINISENFFSQVFKIIIEGAIAGLIAKLLLFYAVLHCWLNAFAEMLRFGERQFYTDWWTATNYKIFFRKWNIVVSDWLYEYIYQDFFETITPNSRTTSKLIVFLISAIFHEYIGTVSSQHFFPLLFLIFLISGLAFTHINTKHRLFNIPFLYFTGLGVALLSTFYAIEFVVNQNCAINKTNVLYNLIPRILRNECVNFI
ncbi:sterol O-acyltransferase 1-like [Onthophagus taurus]|uniref:sterol O-acyltransferase 1-like n=1 Tax=Onthophagus taurus TaxID=166361 RepID=UPI0039BEBF74